MTGRLPTGLLVAALLKRVNDAGGMGMVRARGDADGGAVLMILHDAGAPRMMERCIGPTGRAMLVACGPDAAGDPDAYWRRRRQRDPDLWVVELDIPSAERFVAETLCDD